MSPRNGTISKGIFTTSHHQFSEDMLLAFGVFLCFIPSIHFCVHDFEPPDIWTIFWTCFTQTSLQEICCLGGSNTNNIWTCWHDEVGRCTGWNLAYIYVLVAVQTLVHSGSMIYFHKGTLINLANKENFMESICVPVFRQDFFLNIPWT